MATAHGPFTTEAEARPVRDRAHAARIRHDHLLQAVAAAGVTLGAFDAEIVAWLAHTWEPTTVAVFAGLITRAHTAGKIAGGAEA